VIQRVALFAGDTVSIADIPPNIRERNAVNVFLKRCHQCFADGEISLDELLACLEVNMLRGALQHAKGNKTHAAQYLRLSLSTFRDKLKKYKLDGRDFE
jgi:DNA-binding NtrC family response regulator